MSDTSIGEFEGRASSLLNLQSGTFSHHFGFVLSIVSCRFCARSCGVVEYSLFYMYFVDNLMSL